MLAATVSGSFHRHLSDIYTAVGELLDLGVEVLSPADPRVIDQIGDFLFVASDRVRSIRLVQDRHLRAIAASDFLWVVAPDGYVGRSASMEIGAAVVLDTPIFSTTVLDDSTLAEYVVVVAGVKEAVERHKASFNDRTSQRSHFLLNPSSIESALDHLEYMRHQLIGSRSTAQAVDVYRHRDLIVRLLSGPPDARGLTSLIARSQPLPRLRVNLQPGHLDDDALHDSEPEESPERAESQARVKERRPQWSLAS